MDREGDSAILSKHSDILMWLLAWFVVLAFCSFGLCVANSTEYGW